MEQTLTIRGSIERRPTRFQRCKCGLGGRCVADGKGGRGVRQSGRGMIPHRPRRSREEPLDGLTMAVLHQGEAGFGQDPDYVVVIAGVDAVFE